MVMATSDWVREAMVAFHDGAGTHQGAGGDGGRLTGSSSTTGALPSIGPRDESVQIYGQESGGNLCANEERKFDAIFKIKRLPIIFETIA